MKSRTSDLTQGAILPHLLRLAIPSIGASFMQMAYNLTDMIWLGRLGENAVAAVGAAGFFVWFGFSLLLITRVGAEIGVSQALGRKEPDTAIRFARHALFWAVAITAGFALLTYFLAPNLIGFFGIPSPDFNHQGSLYLRIVSVGFIFTFVNPTFAGIYNGMGNSRAPFWYMTCGIILNIILDPVLIFGWWIFPELGVKGAALATLFSQSLVFLIFIVRFILIQEMMPLQLSHFRLQKKITKRIFELGIPVAAESALFSVFAMILAKMVAGYGAVAIAVQSIGGQIEAISWMTATGFATALGSFTGQNFGAGNWNRIKKGYQYTMLIGALLGLIVSVFFLLFGKSIFSLFFSNPDSQQLGAIYLYILAISQIFMITEITTRGAFNGIGKTLPPSLIGITFTGFRIPMAWLLMSFTGLGLYSVWWSITLTSVIKGTILPLWFWLILKYRTQNTGLRAHRKWIFLLPSRLRQQVVIREQ